MRKFLTALTVILILATLFFGYRAYDVKNNYYMSVTGKYDKHAYVGGDAYNYIINANYFTGYAVSASTTGLSALICILFILDIKRREEQQQEQLYALERKDKENE